MCQGTWIVTPPVQMHCSPEQAHPVRSCPSPPDWEAQTMLFEINIPTNFLGRGIDGAVLRFFCNESTLCSWTSWPTSLCWITSPEALPPFPSLTFGPIYRKMTFKSCFYNIYPSFNSPGDDFYSPEETKFFIKGQKSTECPVFFNVTCFKFHPTQL